MEVIDFATGGPEAFGAFDYAQASEEEVSFFPNEPSYDASVHTAMESLSERVRQNHTHMHTFSTIDNVVKVRTLNAQVRQEKIGFWRSRRTEVWTVAGLGCAEMLASGLLIAAGGGVLPGLLGAIGLASTVLGFYRGSQASEQIVSWSLDLPIAIANKRKVAFEEGLMFVMKQDHSNTTDRVAYSSIMTTKELQGLYNVYFHDLARRFERNSHVKDQIAAIEEVALQGPLCRHVFNYAKLHPQHVQQLSFYIHEHEKFVKAFASIEKRRLEQEKQVSASASQQIYEVERQKNIALAVVNQTYNEYKKRVEMDKGEALSAAGSHEEEEAIRKEFDQKLEDARQLRDLGRAVISYPFDIQQQNIEKERDQFITQIHQDRDAQLLPFYSHISLLHTNAYRVLIGKPPSAYPTLSDPFTLSFHPPVFTMPVPSAPPFEATFGGIRDQYDVNSRVYDEFMNVYRDQYAS